VRETLERLEAERLLTTGTGRTRAEAEATRFLDVQGLRVAFLAFTDLLNADLNRGPGEPWVRPLDLPEAEQAVREARVRADVVVVSLHWGAEYRHEPLARQRQAAAALAEAGASLILGHHPHVLQPVAWVGQGERRALVAYSMGNFIANQDRTYEAASGEVPEGDSRDGVALQCRLVKRRGPEGKVRVTVEDVRCEALWTDNNWRAFRAGRDPGRVIRVVPVTAALEAALQAPPGPGGAALREARVRTLRVRLDRAASILGPQWLKAPEP